MWNIFLIFIGFSLPCFSGNFFPLAIEESNVEIMKITGRGNISYSLKADLDEDWYYSHLTIKKAVAKSSHQFLSTVHVGIVLDGAKVPLFRTSKSGKVFRRIGSYLESSSNDNEQAIEILRVYDYRNGFYLVPSKKNGNSRVWINENSIYFIQHSTDSNKNGEIQRSLRLKIRKSSAFSEKILASIPLASVFLADSLFFNLQFYKGKYQSTNCGIHALLVAMVMKDPALLESIKIQEDLIGDLERESLTENPTRVVNGLKWVLAAGALHVALAAEDPSQLIDSGAGVAVGLAFLGLGALVPSIEQSVRKNLGIMPKKLEELGVSLLNRLGLNESLKFVRTEKDNFDEMQEDWARILERGSPIIVMERNDFTGGHYVVIHSLCENGGAYIWDQGIFMNTKGHILGPERLRKILDCKRDKKTAFTSFLAGIDRRYVYFHFEEI